MEHLPQIARFNSPSRERSEQTHIKYLINAPPLHPLKCLTRGTDAGRGWFNFSSLSVNASLHLFNSLMLDSGASSPSTMRGISYLRSPSMPLNCRWWSGVRSDGNTFIIKTLCSCEKKSSNKHHMKHYQVKGRTHKYAHAPSHFNLIKL